MEHGKNITADIYCKPLDWVKKTLPQMCPALVKRKHVILQHDKAQSAEQFLTWKSDH